MHDLSTDTRQQLTRGVAWSGMRGLFNGRVVTTLVLILALWGNNQSFMTHCEGQDNEQPKKVTILEYPDAPLVWESVEARPTTKNANTVFRLLEEKLEDWDSHPAGLITAILETIGEKRIESGRKYLLLFLHVDPSLPSATFVLSTTVRVLGSLGGPGALEELVNFARNAPPGVLPSVAVALGILGDPRAVPFLEDLADHPDTKTRTRALSALAKYCSATSRDLVLHQMRDEDQNIRKSAAWWLAACATTDDAPRLASLLHDDAELVRLNALKGLVRMRSRAACAMSDQLLQDKSESVVEVAREYRALCTPSNP